ncbi:MAG TPA: VapC toxin family PIN domain ribonuclease [Polyangia bacterium]|nr:VapC toxin family PIN domain ribonuclease [Polyangia bacterium]
MISVDTEVWLSFARRERNVRPIIDLLRKGIAEAHPLVLAELGLGFSAGAVGARLRDLELLVGPAPRRHEEVLTFARENGVIGAGIGYVDAHLLASAYLDGRLLWSSDSEVQRIAHRLGVGFRPAPE